MFILFYRGITLKSKENIAKGDFDFFDGVADSEALYKQRCAPCPLFLKMQLFVNYSSLKEGARKEKA